jgi:hypothetical protein
LVDDLVQAKRRILNLLAGLAGILCFALGHRDLFRTIGNEAGRIIGLFAKKKRPTMARGRL